MALEYMRHYQPTPKTRDELVLILRLRFLRPRTWDEINHDIVHFECRKYDNIATFMDRFDDLLTDQRCVDIFFTLESADICSWQQFVSNCTVPDLREKLQAERLLDPCHKAAAIAFAQHWYDDRNMGPWAVVSDSKKMPPKAKGSLNTVEVEEELEELPVRSTQ